MQFSMKCSIAVHCLIFIHEANDHIKVTSPLLSLSTGVNPATIRSILSVLKKAGIIQVELGTGGATLQKDPRDINLYMIDKAVEPHDFDQLIKIHPCKYPLCPVARSMSQLLRRPYQEIEEVIRIKMESIDLQSLIEDYRQSQVNESTQDK